MKNRIIVVGIVLVAVLAFLLLGGAGMMMGYGGYGMMGYGGYGMMGRYGYPYGYGFNPIGSTVSLVFWALAIAGVVLLVVWFVRKGGRPATSHESSLDILKSRYAKGEISKEQYESMKTDVQ